MGAEGMLTDQGAIHELRGTTRFERELGKDRVKHIKSQTASSDDDRKMERFWKTIYEEFLLRRSWEF